MMGSYTISLIVFVHGCVCQAGEPVLSALGACKMLRELSKLESETESKLAMKELAQMFENLAQGECFNSRSDPYIWM